MMPIDPKPAQPVQGKKVIIAEHQAGVRPLPGWALEDGRTSVLTRWHLTDAERKAILDGDDIWLLISTFGKPLQPLAMATKGSELAEGWPD